MHKRLVTSTHERDGLARSLDSAMFLSRRVGVRLGDAEGILRRVEKALACHDEITVEDCFFVYTVEEFLLICQRELESA